MTRKEDLKTKRLSDRPEDSDNIRIPNFLVEIRNWFTGLRSKLIIPFGLLTIITAVVGLFMLSRLVTSSIVERFNNQLIEASRVAADGIVRREREHLETLRLMVFTQGVDQAIFDEDADTLQEILFPLAVNEEVHFISAVNLSGEEIITLILDQDAEEYVLTQGEDLSGLQIVTSVLLGYIDESGDKYASIEHTRWGPYLFTSAPVRNEENEINGVMVIGSQLDVFIDEELESQALADIIMLDEDGSFLSSTLPEPEEGYELLELSSQQLSLLTPGYSYQLSLYEREFQVYYSHLSIREDNVGILGIALPRNFIISTEATNRNFLSIIFTIGTLSIVTAGYLISQNIAKPILRLRNVSMAVSSGDLEQMTGIERNDEIGQLANAFDQMTTNLYERTMEVTRLYSESVERSEELTMINAQLQEAQQQLVQSEKLSAIGQLAAGIVHDVKNPLAIIIGLAEEIKIDVGDESSDAAKALDMISANAYRANDIVGDLLLFARQSESTPSYQDINETVKSSVRLTEYLAKKNKIKMKTQLESPPPLTTYDSQQIGQVLINLLQNAIQAMPDGGEINIQSSRNKDWVEISIQDTGVGIPEENLSKVFDPFFTTKPEGEGTGLGLSVSYGIVAQHRGRIEVQSKAGEGSTFIIKLPHVLPELEDED